MAPAEDVGHADAGAMTDTAAVMRDTGRARDVSTGLDTSAAEDTANTPDASAPVDTGAPMDTATADAGPPGGECTPCDTGADCLHGTWRSPRLGVPYQKLHRV